MRVSQESNEVANSGILTVCAGENHLSFIETSALDASNVELAFQNILTGAKIPLRPPPGSHGDKRPQLTVCHLSLQRSTESYRARPSTAAMVHRPRLAQEPTSP